MTNPAKSITAAFLMLVVFIPFGISVSLNCMQWIARLDMRERLENAKLHSIEIPADSFRWYEEGSEVIVDHRLFDVKSYRITAETVYVTGLFDEEETQLKEEAAEMQRNSEEGENAENLAHFFLFGGFQADFDLSLQPARHHQYVNRPLLFYPGPSANPPFTPPDSSL